MVESTLTEPFDLVLNEQFSLENCSFFDEHDAVIFSSLTQETLLCTLPVLVFLENLNEHGNISEALRLLPSEHIYVKELLNQLVQMRILTPRYN